MYCKYCGNEVQNYEKFCEKCGQPTTDPRIAGYTQPTGSQQANRQVPPTGSQQQSRQVPPNGVSQVNRQVPPTGSQQANRQVPPTGAPQPNRPQASGESAYDGFSITALILGISGVILWIIPILGFPVTIVGIIMGIMGRKKRPNGMALAGLILSIIMLVFTTISAFVDLNKNYWENQRYQQYEQERESWENAEIYEEEHTLEIIAGYRTYSEEVVVTDENIVSAKAQVTETASGEEEYSVEIVLDEEGKQRLAHATEEHIGEAMPILYDGEVISNPVVEDVVSGGTFVITGLDSYEQAVELADALFGKV